MHINIICPHCLSRFQVDPSLRGQQMRCPNRSCREVFEVQEAREESRTSPEAPGPRERHVPSNDPHIQEMPPAVARDKSPRARSGGEPVPILPASTVPDVRDWHEHLPPRRHPGAEPEPPPRKTKPEKRRKAPIEPVVEDVVAPVSPDTEEPSAEPVEFPSGPWDAPPVLHPARAGGAATSVADQAPITQAVAHDTYVAPRTGRHAWKIIAALLLLVFGILGGAAYYIWTVLQVTEDEQRSAAKKAYDEGRLAEASKGYAELLANFPQSESAGEYTFFKELSDLRASMAGLGQHPSRDRLDKLQEFLKGQKDNPLLPEHIRDLGDSLAKYLRNVPDAAGNDPAPEIMDFLEEAERVVQSVSEAYPKAILPEERTKIESDFAKVRLAFAQAKQRRDLIAELQQLLRQASPDAIKHAHLRVRQESRTQPGLARDPAILDILSQLYSGHRQKIVYRAGELPAVPIGRTEAETSGLLIDANVGEFHETSTGDDRATLALARGVLYALSQKSGRVLWATRVGIDVTSLPVRVPSTAGKPEMLLLLTGEARMLHALDVRDGSLLWKCALPAPCLGRPVVLDARVYVTTISGLVLEIDLAGGQVLGHYDLGQRLSMAGAHMEGTKLLFFPADELCIYVLDVAKQECASILYTEHAAGPLRGEPILVRSEINPGQPAEPNGYLILGQTAGLDAWELHAFSFPPAAPVVKPEPLQPEPRLPGWPWYPAYRDSEKIVQVTDAAALGLFGFPQPNNQDPPLFPLVGGTGMVDLSPWLAKPADASRNGVSRKQAQVVLCQDLDLWVLVQDQLLRMQLANDRVQGPTVTPSPHWPGPLPLGSPLHAGQVDETGSTLFLVTQPARQATCRASAVHAKNGAMLWQRQLGLVCRGEPIQFGKELLALDQGGGLFRFEPDKHPNLPQLPWQIVGNNYVAPAVENTTPHSSYLVPAPDGASAVEISLPSGGSQLIARHYHPARDGKPFVLEKYKQELNLKSNTTLAGPPALRGNNLLLPLTDKSLIGLQLPLGESVRPDPPNWRADRALADARGYALWIGDNEFITSNGAQGLTHWRWPADGPCQAIPDTCDANNPTTRLPANIAAPPVMITGEGDKSPVQITVADANGTLFLMSSDNLQIQRRWDLKGKITAGPFVRGSHVGCIVDSRRLVWIDPAKERPLWDYKSAGEGIVGEPGIVANMVVVADQSGRFVGLDPVSGLPLGPGFTLQGNVSPACSPVAFGPDRAFAPLADGTILLLSLSRLRNPLPAMLPAW